MVGLTFSCLVMLPPEAACWSITPCLMHKRSNSGCMHVFMQPEHSLEQRGIVALIFDMVARIEVDAFFEDGATRHNSLNLVGALIDLQ